MFDSLWPHGLQHTRFLCSPRSPGVCSNSCPLSRWCHPTISFSFTPFSSCPQSCPVSGSFPMSLFFTSGGQSIGTSFSIDPSNEHSGFIPLGLTGLTSLLSKGLSGVFSSIMIWKHQFFRAEPCLWSNSHIHTWLLEKIIALAIWTFVGKVMSLLFNTMFRFILTFLPRRKCLLISWL